MSSGPYPVVRWEQPPDATNQVYDWSAIAAALRTRPGVWAVVAQPRNATLAGQMARRVRERMYEPMRRGRWEAIARTDDGVHKVYARFVGEVTEGE